MKFKAWITALFAVTLITAPTYAQTTDEADGIRLSSLNLAVDVRGDHSFTETMDVELKNLRASRRNLLLSTPRGTLSTRGFTLGANASGRLRRTDGGIATGETLRCLSVHPALQVGGESLISKAKVFRMSMMLPPGARRIVYASLEPTSRTVEGGRVVYRWSYTDLYPTPIFVLYQTTPHEIEAEKKVTNIIGDVWEIEVIARNVGSAPVSNVAVLDEFAPFEVTPQAGQGGFEEVQSLNSDPRLVFSGDIAQIPAGGSAAVKYRVVVAEKEMSFRPARLYVGGVLVSMTNDVDRVPPL